MFIIQFVLKADQNEIVLSIQTFSAFILHLIKNSIKINKRVFLGLFVFSKPG